MTALLDLDATWQDQAACRGLWELFFAPPAERPNQRANREAQAKAICRRCPVLGACHRYATEAGEAFHIWAGIDRESTARARRLAYRKEQP